MNSIRLNVDCLYHNGYRKRWYHNVINWDSGSGNGLRDAMDSASHFTNVIKWRVRSAYIDTPDGRIHINLNKSEGEKITALLPVRR